MIKMTKTKVIDAIDMLANLVEFNIDGGDYGIARLCASQIKELTLHGCKTSNYSKELINFLEVFEEP